MINEGEAFNLSLNNAFSDPENDAVSVTVTGLPGWATFNAGSKTITGTPGAGAVNQSHTVTVTGSSKADSGGTVSDTFVLTINDAPDLTAGGGGNAIFSAGGGAVALDNAITLADAEGNFNGGTVRIQSSAPAGSSGTGVTGGSEDDSLAVTPQTVGGLVVALSGNDITVDGVVVGTIDAAQNGTSDITVGTDTTGKSLLITFNGNATTARVQAVLQSLQFNNSETTVVEANRSIQITVSDANGAEETFTTTVEAYNNQRPSADDVSLNVNEDVTLTLTAANFSVNFTDGDGDTLQSVQITELPTAAQGKLQLNGSDIAVNTVITKAQIDAGQLKFVPTADFNGTVTFKFAVGDGKQYDSTPNTATVTVAPVDDAPKITSSSGRTTPVNVARAILIDPGLALVDPDATGSAAGTYADTGTGYLQIAITTNKTAGDVLSISNFGTGAGQIGFDGTTITYAGTTIGTIDGTLNGKGNQALKINLNNAASNDAVQALARAITIRTSDRDSDSAAQKTITFTASDGENANTVGATRTVDFSASQFDNFDPSATRNVISSNGANDYINISGSTGSDFIDQGGAFTWEAWAKPLTGSGTLTLFSVGDVKDVSIINTSFSSSSGISTSGTPSVTGGKLLLSPATGGSGSATVTMPDAAKGAKEFTASFNMLIGDSAANASGDGMSFNYGSGTINGEEGVSNGLSITFDTYDNGSGDKFNTIAVYVDGEWKGSGTPSGGIRTEPSSHVATFDGVNDMLRSATDSALQITDNLTVELWVKPESTTTGTGGEDTLVAIGGLSGDSNSSSETVATDDPNNYLFELKRVWDGGIKVFHESEGGRNREVSWTAAEAGVSANEWTHISVTRDVSGSLGGTYTLYINGVSKGTKSYDTSDSIDDPNGGSNAQLTIGASRDTDDSPTYDFNGQIDDVRIWNVERSSSDISRDYDKEVTGSPTGLVAHYTFDDSIGDDSSTNNGSQDLSNYTGNVVSRTSNSYGPQAAVEVQITTTVTYNSSDDTYRLTVSYDGTNVITDLNLGSNYNPDVNDVFSFGVRTGSANDKHQVDNLQITANDAGTQHSLAVVNGVLSLITETNEGTTVTSSGVNVFSDGEFHHLAASYNNGTVKLYVDGDLAHTATGIEKLVTQGNAVIGATSGDSQANFWNGLIAEMRVWDSALSDDAIKNDYLPDIDDQSGLIGYWTFDGSSTSYTDQSGSGHTASYGGSSNWSQSAQTFFVSPNSTEWTVVEGSDSGSTNDIAYIDPDTGELVVQNRELVRSADQHKPASTDPVHATGTFKFSSGTDGFMHVMTRTDPSSKDANGLPANGLNFSAVEGDDRILIDRFVNGSLTSVANSGNGSIDFRKDVEYSFDVYDDGSTVRLTVTEVGNPSNTATITATDTTDFSSTDNYVVLTSREDTNSGGEQVVRFDNIQIDNDIVLSEDGSVDVTLPTTGLTGPFTFKLLDQPEHGSISNFTDNSTDNTLTYTPTSGYHGGDTITVQVTDTNGSVNVHQISFAIDADLDVQVAGKVLEFDGSDYVQAGRGTSDALAITGDITIEGWFKPTDTSAVQNFIYFGGEFDDTADANENMLFGMGISADGEVYANHQSGTGTSNALDNGTAGYDTTSTVTFGEWNHVAAVRDTAAQTWKIYIDGELVQETSYADNPAGGSAGQLYLGGIKVAAGMDQYFSGQMDEIRIWSEARSDEDIRQNYDQQLSGSESNLVSYYRFDDVQNGTVQDETSNNNDGTLGATDTLGDSAEPNVVDPADNASPPVYGNIVDTAENTATTGLMVYDNTDGLSGTVSYAIDNGAGGSTTSFTTAKNGTVTIDANTGSWTYTPATNYAGSDSFTLIAAGATSGSTTETISVNVAGAGDENSIGMPDGVLQLDGNGDYVDLGSPSQLGFGSNAFTVETWIRTGVTSNTRMNLLNLGPTSVNDQGTYLFIENGKFSWDTYASTDVVSTTSVNDQQWHHVAVVRDGTTIKVFVDGQLEASGTHTFTVPQAASTIGTNDGSSFKGEIDEFRIWSDARTDDEIAANYQKQMAGNENNLTAYYRFDDDPDGTTVDNKATSTGSALDATLAGDARITSIPLHAMNFDGSNDTLRKDLVSGDSVLTGSGSFTYEMRIKTDAAGVQTMMSIGENSGDATTSNGTALRIESDGSLGFNRSTGDNSADIKGTTAINDGLWHHVAVSYDQATGITRLLVDGEAVAATTLAAFDISDGVFRIGTGLAGGNDFTGQISDVRIWNVARTDAEVADNVNTMYTGNEGGKLIAHYPLDEVVSNNLLDTAGTLDLAIVDNAGTDATLVETAPTIQGTAGEIQENATLSGQMSGNDVAGTPTYSVSVTGKTTSAADADGRVTVETANGGTVVIDQSTGAWTYKPANNWYGTDSFNLTATGDNSTSDSETISVTVNNDAENSIVINDGVLDASGSGNGNYAQASLGTGTITNALTMEMSVNFAKIPSTDHFLAEIAETGTNGRFLAYINTSGKLVFLARNADNNPDVSIVTEFQPTTDTWYDLSFVFDNSTLQVYVDGELQAGTLSGSPSGADMAAGNANTLRINGSHTSVNSETKVLFDEVKIWSEARTHDQIRDGIDQPVASGTNNLEAYYKFDDQVSSTAVQDQSGNNRDLTLNGEAQTVNDLKGGLSFDGSDDVVTITNDASLNSAQGTWSTWFKWDTTANPTEAAVLMSRHDATTSYNGLHISVEPDGDVNVQGKDADSSNLDIIATNPGVIDGAWHQVTLVYDQAAGGLNKLYVDGQLVGAVKSTAAWNWGDQDLLIGDSPDPFWTSWKGEIGPVQIYNTKLTDEQVADQFGNEVDPATSGLVGHYDFTEGSGSTAANDATGGTQTPDATVSGATWIDLDNDTTATTLVIQEDEIATGHMLANDVPGTASYSIATNGQHGTVTMNSDGTWSYKPVENYYGTDTFTLRVSSTFNGTTFTDDQTVTVTINSVDDGNAVQISDGAANLDGTNDYIDIPDSVLNANEGTISLRFNAASGMDTARVHYLFGNDEDLDGNRLYVYLEHDGSDWRVKARLDTSDKVIDGGVIQEGQWYETATVWRSDGTGEFFIDGDSAGTVSGLTLDAGVQDSVAIGAYDEGSSGDQFFKGQIDEVSIWSTAQTAEDIRSRVGQQLSGEESNLTAYYRFDDDPDGNVARDLTSNGNDGTLTNGAKIVDPASNAEPTVLGNEIEIQSSEVAAGKMTGIDVPGTPAYSIVGGTTTFTTANGGSVTVDASTGAWTYDPADGYYGSDSFTLRASSTSGGVNFTDDETVTVTIKSDTNVEANDGVLQVDAQSSWVQINDNAALDITGDITIEAWIRPQGDTSNATYGGLIAGKENSYLLSRLNDGSIQFALNGTGGTWAWTDTGYDAPAGSWTHLALSFDASARTVKLYANGEHVSTSTDGIIPTDLTQSNDPFFIGGRSAYNERFSGLIDEVRVWNGLRTDDEIRENYDQKIAGDSDNLAGYWNFDEIENGNVQDTTSNDNDASLSGNARVINTTGPSMDFDRSTNGDVAVSGIDSELQNSSFTIEYWARRDAASGDAEMPVGISGSAADDTSYLHFGYSNGTNMRFGFNQTGSDNELNYTDTGSVGEWVHWAATYDADNNLARIYRNGELVAIDTFANDFDGAGDFHMGYSGYSDQYFDGALNDVRVWNTARTGDEIATNYNTTLTGDQGGTLIANYTFEETSGTTVKNTANEGTYDGTASGGYNRIDDSPNIYTNKLTIEENEVVQGNMNSAGADGSATFSADATNAHGTVTIDSSTGRWTYTPHENYNGSASFVLTATGANGTVDNETINVTIQPDAAQRSPITNGGVLVLDGTDDYVTVADNASLNLAGAFTIEAWVNLNDSSPLQNIVDKFGNNGPGGVGGADGVNYRLFVDNGHIGVFSIASGTVKTADGIVQSGEWTHISASFDGTDVTFYVNGEPVGDPQAFTTDGVNAGALTIGRDDVGRQVDGMIDDVRIWNDARTAEEIQTNYDQLVSTGDGLVGNWIFDTADGTTVSDRSGNNNNGTLTNGADVLNVPQQAISFDGGDYIDAGAGTDNELRLDGDMTVELWVKPDTISGTQALIALGGKNGDAIAADTYLFGLNLNASGQLFAFHENGSSEPGVTTLATLSAGEWAHVSVTRDVSERTYTVFINGEAVSTGTYSNTLDVVSAATATNATFKIGTQIDTDGSSLTRTFTGDIADVRVWNTVRTDQQIADHYNQAIAGDEGGALVAHYEFNETSGQTVTDTAGNNDATLGADNTAGTDDPTFVDGTPPVHSLSVAVQENHAASGTMTTNDVVPTSATYGVNSSASHSGTTSLTIANKGTVNIDSTGGWTFTPVNNFNGQVQFYVTASGGGLTDAEQITVDVQAVDVVSNEVNATAAVFDGTDDLLTTTASGMQTGSGAFTLETWFKSNMSGRGDLINTGLNNTSEGARVFLNNGKLYFGDAGAANEISSAGTYNDGNWHHVAASYDGTKVILYVDGEAVAMDDSASLDITSGDVSLGATLPNAGGGNFFNGAMGETRLWSTARTAEEIRDSMNTQVASDASGLEAQYTFADRAGTTVRDATSNDNDLKPASDSVSPSYSDDGLDILTNSITTDEDSAVTGTMTSSDVVQNANYSVTSAAQHGTVSINSSTGEWTYTPNANYSGSDSFQLQATDGSFTDQETISVTVNADNDPSIGGSVLQGRGGTTDYGIVEGINIANKSFTIEAWAYRATDTTDDWVLSQGTQTTRNGLHFGYRSGSLNKNFTLALWGDDLDYTDTDTNVGEWVHWAASFDNTSKTAILYKNGTQVATKTMGGSYTGSGDLLVGTDLAKSGSYNGMVDDLRIWDDVRTADEITAHYDRQLGGSESNLLAYYTMESADGTTIKDKTSNNRDITLNDSDGINSIKLPTSAINLDGTDDHVEIGALSENISGAYTMEAWVKFDAYTVAGNSVGWPRIFDLGQGASDDNLLFALDGTSGKLHLGTYVDNVGKGLTSSTQVPLNEWVHVAGVNDGAGNAYLYINGVQVASGTGQYVAANVVRNSNFIGKSNFAGDSMTDGQVADARLWNVARSADEIAANYDQQLTGNESGLVLNYRFDGLDGTTVADNTSNGNDGTANGGATIVDTLPEIQGTSITLSTADTASGVMTGADVTGAATFSIETGPSHGTLKINSDTGDWTYTPNNNYVGSDTFTLRATGATSGTDDETIALTVTASTDATNTPTQSALQFDGVDDYVDIGPMSENISGAYTFEATVYYNPTAFDNNDQWMRIIDLGQGESDDNLLLAIDPTGDVLSFDTRNGTALSWVKSDTTMPTGEWIHVAGVNDGAGNAYLYINGELVKSDTSGNQQTAQNVERLNNYIGQSNWDGEHPMHGAVADVRIWNDARTADEIKANYNTSLTGSEDSLVAYYTFEDIESGVVRDVTNNGNDAQVINNSADPGVAATGPTGDVLQLDGADDYVEVPLDTVNNLTAGTIETWVKLDSITGEVIFSKQHDGSNSYAMFSVGQTTDTAGSLLNGVDGKVYFRGFNTGGTLTSTGTLQTGQWHHLAVTFTDTQAQLYVDGILDQTQAGNFQVPDDLTDDANTSARIGSWKSQSGNLDGQIDNFRVWSEVRSAEEIREGMSASFDFDTSGLVAQYTFDDVENSTTVLDGAHSMTNGERSNNNDGTLTNGATTIDSGYGGGIAVSHLDKAIRFDGTNDYANDPSDAIGALGANERTIMLWARSSSEEPQAFVSYGGGGKGQQFVFGLNTWDQPTASSLEGGKGVTIDIGSGAITFQPLTGTDDGQWHHYAVVLPSGGNSLRDLKVYQDGVLLTTISALYNNEDVTINTNASGSTFQLGHHGTERYFNGDMSEVSVWSTGLTTAQIKEHMSDQLSGSETGLSAYWRGSDNGSGAVNDYAGGNDLTLANGASIVDVAPDITTSSLRISEDTIATGQVTTSGVNSSATYTVQTAAGNGTVTIDSATGVWNYQPNAGYSGTDTFTLRATGNIETEDEVISVRVGQDPVLPHSYSLSLDGSDDYVDVGPLSEDISGAFTAEAWIKFDENAFTGTKWMRVFDFSETTGANNNGFLLTTHDDTGKLSLYTYNGASATTVTSDTVLPLNEWVHVAAVNDGAGNATLYLNGTAIKTGTGQNALANSTKIYNYLGKSQDSNDTNFKGDIAEARLWNDARSSTEIANSYDKQLNGDEQGLVGYWTFEEGIGNIAHDQSGNGNDATIVGGTHENMTTVSMSAGASYKGLILGADADTNDSLSYSVSSNAAGTLNLDTDGSFEYTNTTDADDSFDVTITDSDGNQTVETIHIDVP